MAFFVFSFSQSKSDDRVIMNRLTLELGESIWDKTIIQSGILQLGLKTRSGARSRKKQTRIMNQ